MTHENDSDALFSRIRHLEMTIQGYQQELKQAQEHARYYKGQFKLLERVLRAGEERRAQKRAGQLDLVEGLHALTLLRSQHEALKQRHEDLQKEAQKLRSRLSTEQGPLVTEEEQHAHQPGVDGPVS